LAQGKQVEIVKIELNGVMVDAKECTKCEEIKGLNLFYKSLRGLGGREASCKVCTKVRHDKWKARNPQKMGTYTRKWQERNRKRQRQLSLDWYYANKEKAARTNAAWYRDNKQKSRSKQVKRKTLMFSLLFNFPDIAYATLINDFNECCAISLVEHDLHIDHFIGLNCGHGGSYLGNLIPLRDTLNESKQDTNPFVWFKANTERFNLMEPQWRTLIRYLADLNGLTPQEYRAYVDWCYANPRDIDAIKADNKRYGYVVSSLELWREATGIQFPIRIDFRNSSEIGNRSKTESA
jgi:hypothetical protein